MQTPVALLSKAVLIVNQDARLSSCPTREEFDTHNFVLDDMVTFDVAVSPVILAMLKLAGKTVWLAGVGLPKPEPQPGRVYLVVHEGHLWPMKKK